jgi:hypothetical protein
MFNTSWLFTAFGSIGTEVTKSGSVRYEVYIDLIWTGGYYFIHPNTDHAF